MSSVKTIQEIKDNYLKIVEKAKNAAKLAGRDLNEIKIIAVSKTQPVEIIENAIDAGIRVFGENYVQELDEKNKHFIKNKALEWHFIGHLQRNKAKVISPYISYIHTVDSERLLNELDQRAKENDRLLNILLQVNTSGEQSKYGCEPSKTIDLAKASLSCKSLVLKGLMTIGTFTDSEKQQRKEFSQLRQLRDEINLHLPSLQLTELSMGMTHDFEVAIDEGATMVRVGTAIFGERDYSKRK